MDNVGRIGGDMDTAPNAILAYLKRINRASINGHHQVVRIMLGDLIEQLEREVPPEQQKGA